jgi:osmotically-inducible protein OsmY
MSKLQEIIMKRITSKFLPLSLIALFVGNAALSSTLSGKCGIIHECPGDAGITTAVQSKLHEHSEFEGLGMIGVKTVNNVVYLNGIVSTPFQREVAESVAREVPGVKRVISSIAVDN